MSTELESLIRPFQTNDVSPAQTYYTFGQVGVPNIVLRLGRGGSGKELSGSYSNSVTQYCEQFHLEQSGGAPT